MKTRALLALFVAGCLAQSALVKLPDYFRAEGGMRYEERRIRNAFGGLRFDVLEKELDARLPRSQAVALSPELGANDFARQRIAEALYPRVLDSRSRQVLGFMGRDRLIAAGPGKALFLSGPAAAAPEPVAPSVAEPPLPLLLAKLLALLGAAALLGNLVASLLGGAGLAISLLAGAGVIAAVSVVSTLTQLPISLWMLGAGGFLAVFRFPSRGLRSARPDPEAIAFAAVLAVLAVQPLLFPSIKWDVRSIWLFHAKQIFFHGFLPVADAIRAEYAWSHLDYPPLVPAWISYLSGPGVPSLSERAGMLGVWALCAATASLLWRAARARFGRVEGALLATALVLGASPQFASGMPDGLLVLLLAYALVDGGSPGAWVALWVASLLKWEGLVLALPLAWAAGNRRRLAGFVPALAYLAWTRALDLPSDFRHVRWADVAAELAPRLGKILASGASFCAGSFFLGGGLFAFFACLALGKRRFLAPAAFAYTFVLLAFLLTPLDLAWHIGTAMERLLAYGAAFSLVAFLVSIATPGAEGSRRVP